MAQLAPDDALAIEIAAALAKPSRYWQYPTDEEKAALAITELVSLKQQIIQADWITEADDAWWQALLTKQLGMLNCLQTDASCLLLQQDLDQDGQDELILCALGEFYHGAECQVYRFENAWQNEASFYLPSVQGGHQRLKQQLLAAPLQTKARNYPDILFNERSVRVNPISD